MQKHQARAHQDGIDWILQKFKEGEIESRDVNDLYNSILLTTGTVAEEEIGRDTSGEMDRIVRATYAAKEIPAYKLAGAIQALCSLANAAKKAGVTVK